VPAGVHQNSCALASRGRTLLPTHSPKKNCNWRNQLRSLASASPLPRFLPNKMLSLVVSLTLSFQEQTAALLTAMFGLNVQETFLELRQHWLRVARRLELLFGGLKVSARVFAEVLQNRRYCLRRSTVPSRSLSREYEREGTSGEGWGCLP